MFVVVDVENVVDFVVDVVAIADVAADECNGVVVDAELTKRSEVVFRGSEARNSKATSSPKVFHIHIRF